MPYHYCYDPKAFGNTIVTVEYRRTLSSSQGPSENRPRGSGAAVGPSIDREGKMKVICNRGALLEALMVTSNVVASRTPKPVLQCVKLSAADDRLTVAA